MLEFRVHGHSQVYHAVSYSGRHKQKQGVAGGRVVGEKEQEAEEASEVGRPQQSWLRNYVPPIGLL